MEASVRSAGMEERLELLRQAHARCRPSMRLLEWIQRESCALQRRQVRNVDRCDCRGLLRDQSEGFKGRRQSRLRPGPEYWSWKERQLALGLVACSTGGLAEGRSSEEIHRLGDEQTLPRTRRFEGRLGQCASRHAQVALRESRVSEGRAFRQAYPGVDQLG